MTCRNGGRGASLTRPRLVTPEQSGRLSPQKYPGVGYIPTPVAGCAPLASPAKSEPIIPRRSVPVEKAAHG